MKKINKGIYVLGAGLLAFGLASCGEVAPSTTTTVDATTTVTDDTTTTDTTTTTVTDDYKMTLYAPSGAPGISVVDLEVNATDKYTVETGKTGVQVKAALEANEVDAVIAPFNVGLAAYNGSGYYQCAAVVTWGNLYLASQTAFKVEDCTAENTILFSQAAIPGKVSSYVLAQKNGTAAADFTYLADSAATSAQIKLADNADKIYLIAEPALTATKAAVKKSLGVDLTVVNVQELYKSITGEDSFPQAALFVRKDTIKDHKGVVDAFVADVEASCGKTATDTAAIAELAVEKELFANATVLTNAMPRAAINFISAKNAKTAINAFVAPVLGGVNPADGFYY